jgi:hypothetical protein
LAQSTSCYISGQVAEKPSRQLEVAALLLTARIPRCPIFYSFRLELTALLAEVSRLLLEAAVMGAFAA